LHKSVYTNIILRAKKVQRNTEKKNNSKVY